MFDTSTQPRSAWFIDLKWNRIAATIKLIKQLLLLVVAGQRTSMASKPYIITKFSALPPKETVDEILFKVQAKPTKHAKSYLSHHHHHHHHHHPYKDDMRGIAEIYKLKMLYMMTEPPV